MCLRIKAPDFQLLTQAIFISQDVGGNLADVVSVIAVAIRERFKLRDFLAALTSQGKATALFIGCLPYGITLITYIATPGYIIPFLNHPVARIVLLLVDYLGGNWFLHTHENDYLRGIRGINVDINYFNSNLLWCNRTWSIHVKASHGYLC